MAKFFGRSCAGTSLGALWCSGWCGWNVAEAIVWREENRDAKPLCVLWVGRGM
jgi:hypothetical protein